MTLTVNNHSTGGFFLPIISSFGHNLPASEASEPLLNCSRLTLGGRLGLAGGGPKAKLLGRGFCLGPEVALPLTLLAGGNGLFMLGFLLAGCLGGVMEVIAARGGLLAPSALTPPSDCSVLSMSLLNIF